MLMWAKMWGGCSLGVGLEDKSVIIGEKVGCGQNTE